MKTTIAMLLSACCLAASAAKYTLYCSKDEVDFWEALDKTNLTVAQKDEVFAAYRSYNSASDRLTELMKLNGLNKPTPKKKAIGADVRDPAIRQIEKIARQQHNRYEVLKRTITKYDPHKTNMTARVARQSMQSKLDTERDIAKWTRKIWKAKLKAEKHDKKVYENWVKDTEKARDKSSDEWKPFFQGQLDQAAAAREEDQQIRDTDM